MSQLILNNGLTPRNFLTRLTFGPYFLMGSLVLFVVLITVITLMFSTRQVTKGYVLNRLDAEHEKLIQESEQKEMQISQVRSLDFIERSQQIKNMVRPGAIVYMSGDTAIASR